MDWKTVDTYLFGVASGMLVLIVTGFGKKAESLPEPRRSTSRSVSAV